MCNVHIILRCHGMAYKWQLALRNDRTKEEEVLTKKMCGEYCIDSHLGWLCNKDITSVMYDFEKLIATFLDAHGARKPLHWILHGQKEAKKKM